MRQDPARRPFSCRRVRSESRKEGRSLSRVVVADDDAAIGQMIVQLLSEEGFPAVSTTEPLRVYDLVKREQPDVVVLDLLMPYLDGWDELCLLRLDEATRHIPVIFLTAEHNAFDVWPARRRAQAFACLYKPFEVEDLLTTVRAAIDVTR